MLKLIRRPTGPGGRRRGVTLVEMLVVVALVVLMMTILVQIFQAATGAMSASRTIQELDVTLRQVDSIIRSDLAGVTACMDPSVGHNNPLDQRGYFEYGENAFADLQGEDTDDYLAFTTRAPEGQVFSGRQYLVTRSGQSHVNPNVQPTTINSQVAEVIYFLRNGNLYRRVFLVAPERAGSLAPSTLTVCGYPTSIFGAANPPSAQLGPAIPVSWQGMNDISCRPRGYSTGFNIPIPNNLGDLSNRENRAFRPRFSNDYSNGVALGSDGIPDDNNADYLPDYYPTLYTDGVGNHGTGSAPTAPNIFVQDLAGTPGRQHSASYNVFAFPFIYPGMYSQPDTSRLALGLGWIHGLYQGNHGPLDQGDNLAIPNVANNEVQVWWGFPTWRETMTGYQSPTSPGWSDPIVFVQNNSYSQPYGLIPFSPTATPPLNSTNFLPPVTTAETGTPAPFSVFNNGTSPGSQTFVAIPNNPTRVWEDDLLLTGVRSFDVKAYDANAPLYNTTANGYFSAGYYDLGYGAASYLGGPNGVGATAQTDVPWQAGGYFNNQGVPQGTFGASAQPVGFGHEGRIPPLTSDFRQHPRRGYNIGDNSAGVIRLARVWDSWSTAYSGPLAPNSVADIDSDIYGNNYVAPGTLAPLPGGVAAYPSFPAPYPSALRGIQIQIRLVDARGEKAKPITIRADFTDKLE